MSYILLIAAIAAVWLIGPLVGNPPDQTARAIMGVVFIWLIVVGIKRFAQKRNREQTKTIAPAT